LLFWKRKKI